MTVSYGVQHAVCLNQQCAANLQNLYAAQLVGRTGHVYFATTGLNRGAIFSVVSSGCTIWSFGYNLKVQHLVLKGLLGLR